MRNNEAKWRAVDRVEGEFGKLSQAELNEALKCLVACGCDSCVRESASRAIESGNYQYFLKLEVLAMRERLKQPELL